MGFRSIKPGWFVLWAAACFLTGCGGGGRSGKQIVVDSLTDGPIPHRGPMTLRAALTRAASGDVIVFRPSLNGGTINLQEIGAAHSVLKGEVYAGNTFSGYQDRDYGPSSLYVRGDVTIDASELPDGITLQWSGGDVNPARVLAVYGNLTMSNVTVRGGRSHGMAISGGAQQYTLARGAGLAVWGRARLRRCTLTDNRCLGDLNASRDRGAFGGGIYANGLDIEDSVISGNIVEGYGGAGGGIYSVGGADNGGGFGNNTRIVRSAISGNRVRGQHAYGGGIFTLSGGPANLATMSLENCTIARNLVEDHPGLPEAGPHYYRGGGVYIGGGSLNVTSCTIAENEVTGHAAVFSGKPNMGGGGVAATIGNAHTVEEVHLQHSIVVGNRLNGAPEDWFAGSLLGFYSRGYNVVGFMEFSQILAPVPEWYDLNRKHCPVTGDLLDVPIAQALDLGGVERHAVAVSAGTDSGQMAVVAYPPGSAASNRIDRAKYDVRYYRAGYKGWGTVEDDFLNHLLAHLRSRYGSILGHNFGAQFGDKKGTTWYGPRVTWPAEAVNAPWISFWRDLDTAIGGRLGPAGLNDEFWSTFPTGRLGDQVTVYARELSSTVRLVRDDQRRRPRPSSGVADIGAIER